MPQSYGRYELREKTRVSDVYIYNDNDDTAYHNIYKYYQLDLNNYRMKRYDYMV